MFHARGVLFAVPLLVACSCKWSFEDGDGDGISPAEGDCWDKVEGPEGTGLKGSDIGPDAEETWYDGFDQDCKGDDDYDADGDGFVPDAYVGLGTTGVEGRDSSQGVTAGMKCSRLQRGCWEAQRSSPVLPTLGTTVWTATAAVRMTSTKTVTALLRWPTRRHTSPRFSQRRSQFPQQTARMLRWPKARATGFLSPLTPRTSIPMLRRPGTTDRPRLRPRERL